MGGLAFGPEPADGAVASIQVACSIYQGYTSQFAGYITGVGKQYFRRYACKHIGQELFGSIICFISIRVGDFVFRYMLSTFEFFRPTK
jgi:hypothetical protein